jgi:basic membrane protein A and related proteins
MKKTILAILVLSLMSAALAGCAPQAEEPEVTRVVYVINGALGDNAFYDSGKAGLDQIAEEFGLETRTIECNFDAGQYEPALQAAVNYADVIFVISYGFEDQLMQYADANPEKIFVNLDTVVQNEGGTITSVDFIEEESAYLTGIVAAMTTLDTSIPNINEDKLIGAVGGDVDPVIEAFVFAYTNGAQSVDPEITVETKYLGTWEDTAKGKQAALQLYDMGADVVFQIAAAAGIGVLQAAAERDLYAIGVDTNQNDLEPGHVIASDIKDVGKAIVDVYRSIVDGSYVPGAVLEYGLATGAVDVDFEAQVDVLPQEIIDYVDEVRQQIISGELVVELYTVE